MRKFTALFFNEIVKVRYKPTVVIFFALILLAGMFGAYGTKLFSFLMSNAYSYYTTDVASKEASTKDEIAGFQAQIEEVTARIDSIEASDDSEENKAALLLAARYELDSVQDNYEVYTLALENGVYPSYENNFLGDIVRSILTEKSSLRDAQTAYNAKPTDSLQEQIDISIALIQDYESVLINKDYSGFLDTERRRIEGSSQLTTREKETELKLLDIRMALMPDGNISASRESDVRLNAFYTFQAKMISIDEGINAYSGEPMSLQEQQFAESELRVMNYRIENNCYPIRTDDSDRLTAFNASISIGMFLITVMMLILAGSSVSHEISTGSIKSLIIAPVKRYKIWLAKFCSLLFIGLAAVLLLYISSILCHGLAFGFGTTVPYVFPSGDSVMVMPAYIFMFLKIMVAYIDVVFLICFAFMFSVISRNTALSVALPLAAFFGGGIAKQVMMVLPNLEILKFLPFNNLDLTGRFFPYAGLMYGTPEISYEMMITPFNFQTPSALFSSIYLLVVASVMLFISFDSFTRRDIR